MPRSTPAANRESASAGSRGRWWDVLRPFLIMVGLPTLLTGFYYGLVASDVFVSETRYAIRTGEQAPATGLLASMLGTDRHHPGGRRCEHRARLHPRPGHARRARPEARFARPLHRADGGHPLPVVAGRNGRGVPRVLPRQSRSRSGSGHRHHCAHGAGLRRRHGPKDRWAKSSNRASGW